MRRNKFLGTYIEVIRDTYNGEATSVKSIGEDISGLPITVGLHEDYVMSLPIPQV